MKANIVWGGLLGIALGAGAVFGFAHGMLPSEPVVEPPARTEAVDHVEPVASDAVVVDVPTSGEVRQRPLRPGSERIGHPLRQS